MPLPFFGGSAQGVSESPAASVPGAPAPNVGQIRPTVAEAKETAKQIGQVGVEARPRGRPRKDALPPVAPAPVAPAPFLWEKRDIEILGDAPFDLGYLIGGPEHEHWVKTRDDIRKGGCYSKFAYVANRLGWQNPIYLVLALGFVEYATAVGKCGAISLNIAKKKKLAALEASEKKVKKSPDAGT